MAFSLVVARLFRAICRKCYSRDFRCQHGAMHASCPGRDAAFFTLLRRTGTVPSSESGTVPALRCTAKRRCTASGTRWRECALMNELDFSGKQILVVG